MLCYCMLGFMEECPNKDSGGCAPDPRDDPGDAPPEGTGGDFPASRGLKVDSGVADVKSTGRKRAVLAKPIKPGAPCEWLGLRYAGGGAIPIVGCLEGTQTNIHHGPDKNTLNNRQSNLHAICSECHNRWHTLNDSYYPEENPGEEWLPEPTVAHSIELATDEDKLRNDIYWNTKKGDREDEYGSWR